MDVNAVEKNIKAAVNLLKALSNEKRMTVMCALYNGEKNVGELGQIVNLSQSALSQHLARLRKDGLVETRRNAQTIYYSLHGDSTKAILHTLHDIYCPCTIDSRKEKRGSIPLIPTRHKDSADAGSL